MTITLEPPVLDPPPHDPVDDGTRRELLLAGAGLLAVGLTGCGDDDEPDAVPASRTIDTAYGPVRLPGRVERPAFLSPGGVDLAPRYDIRPVVVPDFNAAPATRRLLADVEVRATYGDYDLETIAAARPDVIICDTFSVGKDGGGLNIDQARRVAPVAVDPSTDSAAWKDHVRFVARALGVFERLEGDLRSYERRAAALRAKLPTPAPTVTIVSPAGDKMFERTLGSVAGAVADEAGLRPRPLTRGGDGDFSFERLPDLTADVVYVMLTSGDPEEDSGLRAELERMELWRRVPAVRAGRAHFVGGHWFNWGMTDSELMLEDMERTVGGRS